MILIEESKKITVIDLKELNVNSDFQNFIYPYPEDTEVIGMTWNNVNSDGSPDLRVRDNKKLPIMRFGVLSFSTNNGWSEKYFLSNGILAQIFAKEFNKYISLLKNDYSGTDTSISIDITKEYFNLLKEFADKFDSFLTKVKKDEDFINFIKNSHLFSEQSSDKYENIINYVACKDLVVCFEKTADISNLKSKESFALMYLILKKFIDNNIDYANISQLYEETLLSRYQKFIKEMYKLDESNDDNLVFDLSLILRTYNNELLQEYLTILYRFASIVVKADGTVTKEEEAVLKKILSLSENKMLNLSQTDGKKDEKTEVIFQSKEQTLEQSLAELNSLIGLGLVKQEINSLINFVKIQKARESEGLKSSSLSYHIVFTGNPGTGKTTVARVISDIYKNLGVLKQGHLVETDRSGLVAEYVGQTAVKVNKIVDSALDGILFIDEAYSLVGDNQDNYGKEAVATLIKRMEDDRDKLVVILAGYTNEMKDFIDTNPGLKSRFNRYIEFVDYTPEDLLAIYKLQCSKLDYNLTEDASKNISKNFSLAYASRDKSFGNGRFARNIFEKTLEKQANRIASIPSLTKEILTTITIEDIPDELVDWAQEDTSDEKQIEKDEIVLPDEIIAEVYKDGINYKAKIKDTENDITDLINNPAKLKYAYERSGSIRGKKNNTGIYDWRVIASPKTDTK